VHYLLTLGLGSGDQVQCTHDGDGSGLVSR